MYSCDYCSKSFKSEWALHGHARIHLSQERILDNIENTVQWDNIDADGNYSDAGCTSEHVHFEEYFEDIQEECLRYLHIQRATLSTSLVSLLKSGYLLNKTRTQKANIRVYFEVAAFVNNLLLLSAPEANSLLQMMRKVTHMSGCEIPLPARYSSILDNLLKGASVIKSRITKHEFSLSVDCFNTEVLSKLPKAQGAIIDIVKAITKYNF